MSAPAHEAGSLAAAPPECYQEEEDDIEKYEGSEWEREAWKRDFLD